MNGIARKSASYADGRNHQPQQQQQQAHQNAAEEAKQRHFAEQQKRLQQFSTRPGGGQKMDADSLIASIMGKTESQHNIESSKPRSGSTSSTASAPTPTLAASSSTGVVSVA